MATKAESKESIGKLSVLELVELVKELQEEWGVSAAPVAVAAQAAPAGRYSDLTPLCGRPGYLRLSFSGPFFSGGGRCASKNTSKRFTCPRVRVSPTPARQK